MATGNIIYGADQSVITGAMDESRRRANDFYRQLALLQQQYQQQLNAQNSLGRGLDRTIAGTAPSVAATGLQRGVGDIRNAVSAQAAGAGGNNAALANYGGIQALAAAQAKANADAAHLRAQEIAAAQTAKAQLLSQQQSATGTMAGQATGASTALTGQALGGAEKIAGMNENETQAQRNLVSNVSSGIGSAATMKSDEDAKTDIKPVGKNEMDDFLSHIAGFNFKYRDGGKSPGEGPGQRTGVMAQDVHAGGPVGRAVSDGKGIDMKNAIGALLAAVAHVNRKVDARSAA